MEKVTNKDIERFLAVSSGSGDGSGSGSGYGDGSGDGSGDGILYYNGRKVYNVDGINTIFESVHGNHAKGFILNSDLTLTPCYVAKFENWFAHGATLHEAEIDARNKAIKEMPTEQRIDAFLKALPVGEPIPAKVLFEWHSILTGSCRMGRLQFCKEHGINLNRDKFTVDEFISLTENSFGSEVIRQLKETINKH